MAIDYNKLKSILDAPFRPAIDEKVDNDKEIDIDIFLMLPDDEKDNIGVICIGRYELKGNGKNTVAERITANLDDIKNSIMMTNADDYITGRFLDDNIIFVSAGHQYFISGDKVERRDDRYMVAVRNILDTHGRHMITGHLAVGDMGTVLDPEWTKEKSDWVFPSVSWLAVEGVKRWHGSEGAETDDIMSIAVANSNGVSKVMVPDSFRSSIGMLDIYAPIYVNRKGSQINYVISGRIAVLRSKFDSREDKLAEAHKMAIVVRTRDNRLITFNPSIPEVKCKVDYWKGEILRASFTMNDQPYTVPEIGSSRVSIDDKMPDGSTVVKIMSGNPGGVIRPTLLTAFRNGMPTLYSSVDYDIIIHEYTDNVVSKFRLIMPDGKEDKPISYDFAMVGDHSGTGIKRLEFMDVSESSDHYKDLEKLAAEDYKNVVIDEIHINAEPVLKIGEMTQTDRIVRRMTITGFDKNMAPKSIDIETEVDSQTLVYGKDIVSLRFSVPDDERLKEIEDSYRDIEKQMDMKAEAVEAGMTEWRTGRWKNMHKAVSGVIGLVSAEGVSGKTMINIENLDKGKEIEIRGGG
jgi:hypothetical protein